MPGVNHTMSDARERPACGPFTTRNAVVAAMHEPSMLDM